jgi:hypothetical protein
MFLAGATPRVEKSQRDASAIVNFPVFAEESPADSAAYKEREFIHRLDGLSKALSAFSEPYKGGQIDLNRVKALQKAMHDLEKSEWFRPPKAK